MPDRKKVICHLNDCMEESRPDNTWVFVRKDIVEDAITILKEQEAVSAHWDDDTGHWIEGDRNGIDPHTRTTGEIIDTFTCSWCGYYMYWKTPFCPNCGAKMKGRGSGMNDIEKVCNAFRNCITEPKCRDCPWEQCNTIKNKKVEIPIDLALEVNNLLFD